MKNNKSDWENKPKHIDQWIDGATHTAFLDENGDTDMKYIMKCKSNNTVLDNSSKYFGLTSVLVKKEDTKRIMSEMREIKVKYWPHEGCYKFGDTYKKVCFHSSEIRRQIGPFSKKNLQGTDFMEDLNYFMENLPITITSSFIDKEKLWDKFGECAETPYNLSVKFILEGLVTKQLKDSDRVIIVLESRGKKEDALVLDTIVGFIKHGTTDVSAKQFKKIIGVYFNPKRCPSNNKKSYYGLEIADLCAYPIFKFCRNRVEDRAFEKIKSKIYGYPDYFQHGIKTFPHSE